MNVFISKLAEMINVFNQDLSCENDFISSKELVTSQNEYALDKFSSVISSSVISPPLTL